MDKEIDIVIPLGNGSKWNNNELKYCLRSIEKYLKNYKNIYIIGECPDWVNKITWSKDHWYNKFSNIQYIPILIFDDNTPSNDILDKLKLACNMSIISDNFIYFNDDYFLLQETDATTIPNYAFVSLYQQTIKEGWLNWYKEYLRNTYEYLINSFNPNLKTIEEPCYYDLHYPMIINKSKFLHTFKDFKLDKFVIKSIYGNKNLLPTYINYDCKIKNTLTLKDFKDFLNNKWMFSTGDECLTDEVKEYFEELYPNKSKYEL